MLPTCEIELAVSSAAIGRRFVVSAIIAAAFPSSAIDPLLNSVGDDIDFVNSLMNYFDKIRALPQKMNRAGDLPARLIFLLCGRREDLTPGPFPNREGVTHANIAPCYQRPYLIQRAHAYAPLPLPLSIAMERGPGGEV
jgi:hypothetical protein